ncbi:hypothetical protein [Sporosarcina trichiuri]|uniref:hypothetical protein n=1 Tax=Sporosarcina trichiuri TaxID=3056445 RepID=UPI0025B31402|nr:hypothetical protein [Sporosarcina sp. 0.2-SM1T-5]WJY27329.1 hypothetical protein QWT68_15005 [Sporosarcina sp. 0.2-SM1T-5]
MRLPKGITGFTIGESELIPMDGGLFKKVGYDIARKLQSEVVSFQSPAYPTNYYRLDLQREGRTLSILLHEYFPYVAIASFDAEQRKVFVTCDEMVSKLNPFYEVLDAAFLNGAFNPELHDLAARELEQVRFWGAKTNGDVIFNSWD